MPGRDAFSEYHPLVNFLYFGIIIFCSCAFIHPVCLLISFVCAVCYYIKLQGAKATGLLLKGALPLLLLTVIINPAFSHAGVTVLCYLPTGNPLTLESILYGAAAAFELSAVLIWFACFSLTVTSDKFVYLFGRFAPALSLLLSMTLRFVPRFKAQFAAVREVQSSLGRDTENGGVIKRLKNALACFSAVVTWSLENAVETADSMKSRGYGTGKRTAYSIYIFSERDKTALAFLIFCGSFLLAGGAAGKLFWRFYPSVRGVLADPVTVTLQIVFFCLCIMPVIIDLREDAEWKRSRRKI